MIALLLGLAMLQSVLGTTGSQGQTVVVGSGQTLWGIAVQHYPESDPRQAIAAIESRNHLSGATIVPGQRLVLPASG